MITSDRGRCGRGPACRRSGPRPSGYRRAQHGTGRPPGHRGDGRPGHPRRRRDRVRVHRQPGVLGRQPRRRRRPDLLRPVRAAAVPARGRGPALRGQPGPATLSYMLAPGAADLARLLAGRDRRPGHAQSQHVRSLATWVQYLLLVQNYNLHPWWAGTGAAGLAQMWSLVVEVSFYLVLPLLAAMLTLAGPGGLPATSSPGQAASGRNRGSRPVLLWL